MTNMTAEEQQRFDSKWAKRGDCHQWQGPLDRDGYGTFYLRRRNRRAHRVAWFSAHGPLPESTVINHHCRNRACVNVSHLSLLTASENSLRDSASLGYVNSRKTACPRGHAYDITRTSPTSGRTQRVCSVCEREKARRLRRKWAAEDTLRV